MAIAPASVKKQKPAKQKPGKTKKCGICKQQLQQLSFGSEGNRCAQCYAPAK